MGKRMDPNQTYQLTKSDTAVAVAEPEEDSTMAATGTRFQNTPPAVPEQVVTKLSESLQARFGNFDPDQDKIVQFHCPHCNNVYKGTLKECISRMIVDDDSNGEILWRGCKSCWYRYDRELPERSKLLQRNAEMTDALRFKVTPVVKQRDQYLAIMERALLERDELVQMLERVVAWQDQGAPPPDLAQLQRMLLAARKHKQRGDDDHADPIPFDPESYARVDAEDCPV